MNASMSVPSPTALAALEQEDMAALSARFPHLVEKWAHLKMEGPAPSFFDELLRGLGKGRRGEVVLVIRHSNGQVWLHTKRFYPPGVYRLPSGGIWRDEPALDAARRECWEEAGLQAPICDCLGIMRYRLERAGVILPFISYFFVLDGGEESPRPRDGGEAIVDFRRVPPAELAQVAQSLRQLPPAWQDWGQFRALAHEFVVEHWRHG